jgi:anti-anti-sigma factor
MLHVNCLQRDPRTWVLSVEGAVDHSTVPQLREALDALLEKGLNRLVIDLERVTFIASAGFGCFLHVREIVRERGGELVFAGTNVRVREIFDLLGITSLLRFAPDVGGALAQLEVASPTKS